jgi:hypothetical protein
VRQDLLASLRRLSDADLEQRVRELATRERGVTTLLVAHLAELDTREVHFQAGYASLFAYCREALGLAEQEAYNRIAVARAARRFPVILELLESGAVSLTTVRMLSPHLTPANHASVLGRARGKSKAQVEELAAELWPRPDAPTFVRKLPSPMPRGPAVSPAPGGDPRPTGLTAAPEAAPTGSSGPSHTSPSSPSPTGSSSAPPSALSSGRAPAFGTLAPPATPPPVSSPPGNAVPVASGGPEGTSARRAAEVTPLSPDRYRVQVTIGTGTLEKLRLAKDLLRHSVPSGDEAVILDRALTALLEDIARRQCAATSSPRPAPGATSGSRHVPAEVRRRVWLRDAARCAFVGTGGRRCSERSFLEFHHVKPFALGGEATVENVQLRCRSHNAYEARLYFAPDNGSGHGGADLAHESAPPGALEAAVVPAGQPAPVPVAGAADAARRRGATAGGAVAATRSGTSWPEPGERAP